MKSALLSIYRHFIFRSIMFWMLLFATMRLLFIMANGKYLAGSFGHKVFAFIAALRIDLAMAAYLTIIPLLLWVAYLFFKKQFLIGTARVFSKILVVPVVFISLMNIGNYANWGTVINKRVLLYFENPAEVSHFMSTWQLILAPILVIGLCWLVIKWYGKTVQKYHTPGNGLLYITVNILLIPFLVVAMRGGVQRMPIGESAAYYSPHNPNNHAALNPVYYFAHSASEYFYVSNKYAFYNHGEEKQLLKQLMQETNMADTVELTRLKNPNLVIILLESWTADVVEALDGDTGVAPFTNQLVKESFVFTRCYGSGYRTDQGLVSVLAGYPSQPDNSIIAYPSKTETLPSLCAFLKQQNYSSSFFYGGDIGFANMKSFIVQQGFEYISDKSNYSAEDYNSKWGAHDGKVLESQVTYLNKSKQPFISGLLTLSTHEPFEVPIAHKFPHDSDPNKFRNSAYYTDVCLRQYFEAIRKTAWYNNTLILLVADHGHHLPRNRNLDSPESKRITCILTGGALTPELRGGKWAHTMNQHDLVKMLAPYYGMNPQQFPYAKDPFKATHPFAYYANENVLGFVTDSASVSYALPTGVLTGNRQVGEYAKAYLQAIYSDFTRR